MKRSVFWLLLLTLSASAVEKKNKSADMDNQLSSAASLLEKADSLFKREKYSDAIDLYIQSLERAQEEFNRSVETEALAQLARTNLKQGEKEEGRVWLDQATLRADDSDPMGWSRYLGVRGRFEWQENDLTKARQTFEDMFEYCSSNALWSRAVDAAHMVAIVAESFEDQVIWGKRGIEIAEKSESENWLGSLWNNLAGSYYENSDFESALTCYEKAREYHWRFSGEKGKLFADYHVGMTLRNLKQYKKAASWLRPVLAWAERLDNHLAIGQACEDLGEIQIALGNKEAGLNLLRRARDEFDEVGLNSSWPEVWEGINKRIAELE